MAVMLALIVAVSMAPISGVYADEVTDGTAVTTGTDGASGTDTGTTGTDATTDDGEEGDPAQDPDSDPSNNEDPNVIPDNPEPEVPARFRIHGQHHRHQRPAC